MLEGSQGRAQGFEVGRLSGNDYVFQILFQEIQDGPVASRTTHEKDVIMRYLVNDLDNLPGYHLTETGGNVCNGLALVQRMGAVGLAENRASPADRVGLAHRSQIDGVTDFQVHPPYLLEKELPCA